jgi:hypothetical protein
VIKEAVDIEGPGPGQLTIAQSTAGHRVIQVKLNLAGQVKIAGLHVTGGSSSGPGGDIENDDEGDTATLIVENCLVTDGSAEGYGGGIDAFGGPLILRSSVVEGNEADGGGGIWAGGGSTPYAIESSTIAGNTSMGPGGGLDGETEASGHSTIVNSTLSGNAGRYGGGAFISAGGGTELAIVNSTFSGNSAEEEAAGLEINSGSATTTIEGSTIADNHAGGAMGTGSGLEAFGPEPQRLIDSIVAENQGISPDLGGKWSTSFSLIDSSAAAETTETVPGSDVLGIEPQLGPLADNGGPTRTMALAATSPAVNKGGGGLSTDQRGDQRPVAYPGVANSSAAGANGADIGAYELQAPPPPTPIAQRNRLPSVRIKCPKGAKPGGCTFKLQVVSGKPKRVKGKLREPKTESAVAKVKLKPGRSALVTLKPKPKFAAKLDVAKELLVREIETAKGKTATAYRQLKVVG